MSTPAIEVENLGKSYRLRGIAKASLRDLLVKGWKKNQSELFWALRDVSFQVPRGASVGVVGPNGSGKSSLLGLIAGTITPTTGSVRTHGTISSLLELGAGFHPDLSGRENVFLNAAVLGIAREDVARRMDHIIEFSGLRDFIDMPVKNYSSGMYVRLGFAVAVEMNPEILLVDEVLAVGDLAFQMKCLDRIREFQKRGKTILLVTHDLVTVEQFCDEVKLIHQGHLVSQGNPSDVILTYLKTYMARIGHLNVEEHGTREVELTHVRMLNENNEEATTFTTGNAMTVEIHYRAKKRLEQVVFGFSIKTGNGFFIFGTNTQIMKVSVPAIEGEGIVRLRIHPLSLMEGKYFLSLSCHSWDHATQYHRLEDWYPFAVKNKSTAEGVFQLPCSWEIKPNALPQGN
ncbi:MAG: ABC transporter ATP-binding protein [Verrucomicrobia bacterium]|nr:ABC transporter ATP-binding protein [Verrucomicrobiota bacterium]